MAKKRFEDTEGLGGISSIVGLAILQSNMGIPSLHQTSLDKEIKFQVLWSKARPVQKMDEDLVEQEDKLISKDSLVALVEEILKEKIDKDIELATNGDHSDKSISQNGTTQIDLVEQEGPEKEKEEPHIEFYVAPKSTGKKKKRVSFASDVKSDDLEDALSSPREERRRKRSVGVRTWNVKPEPISEGESRKRSHYSTGELVLVRPDPDEDHPFWIARLLEDVKPTHSR